ncbi:MAG: hypothetical protein NZ899_02370 [Thermoguttaceae bacterium]|nr:hypothetical protein [Thermoguttaceae bacterium]MDW8079829.1 hypothetical protein [Thermoguttaceae bacterium]
MMSGVSNFLRQIDPAHWVYRVGNILEEAWQRAELFFQDHWAIFWLGAIVIGIWCLTGYALRKTR